MNHDLNLITNENGGGLSTSVTGKYTSVRHERAMRDSNKLTGGQVATLLRKAGYKVTARDLIDIFRVLIGGCPEWHHSGFYSKGMGRTYFYTIEQAEEMLAQMPTMEARRAAQAERAAAEKLRKESTNVQGYSYRWVKEGKRNVKELFVYSGSLAGAPKGFAALEPERYKVAKAMAGTIYYGYNEPRWSDFDPEAYAAKRKEAAAAKRRATLAAKKAAKELAEAIAKEAQEREERHAELLAGAEGPHAILLAWAQGGGQHPAPAAVIAAKESLKWSWKQVNAYAHA